MRCRSTGCGVVNAAGTAFARDPHFDRADEASIAPESGEDVVEHVGGRRLRHSSQSPQTSSAAGRVSPNNKQQRGRPRAGSATTSTGTPRSPAIFAPSTSVSTAAAPAATAKRANLAAWTVAPRAAIKRSPGCTRRLSAHTPKTVPSTEVAPRVERCRQVMQRPRCHDQSYRFEWMSSVSVHGNRARGTCEGGIFI